MSGKRSLRVDQSGVASLLFSMIMMFVISLIVLSFAQLARRGQNEVLSNQLSNQAYYAAESGVNDVANVIKTGSYKSDDLVYPGCHTTGVAAYNNKLFKAPFDSGDVTYTCVRVNPFPESVVVSDVPANGDTKSSKVLNITPRNLLTVNNTVTVKWTTSNPADNLAASCPSGSNVFTPSGTSWTCPYGVLRFDLVGATQLTTLNRTTLATNTMGVFAVPTSGSAGNASFVGSTDTAVRINANCTADNCTASISNVPPGSFALRITAKYVDAASVSVSEQSDGAAQQFTDTQAIVDVTGKAQNVLRRVEARVSLGSGNSTYSDYALGSQENICKRFYVSPYGTISPDDPTDCPSYPTTGASVSLPVVEPPAPTPTPPVVTPTPPVFVGYSCPGGGYLSGADCVVDSPGFTCTSVRGVFRCAAPAGWSYTLVDPARRWYCPPGTYYGGGGVCRYRYPATPVYR